MNKRLSIKLMLTTTEICLRKNQPNPLPPKKRDENENKKYVGSSYFPFIVKYRNKTKRMDNK